MKSKYRQIVTGINRRTFLKSVVAGGAASIVGPRLWAADVPAGAGKKVNLACIGIGGQGASDVQTLMQSGLANVVALCDTEMGTQPTQQSIRANPNAPQFRDFRKMFDKMGKEIDACLIATPDFSHFPIAMLAMSLGKGVYVEKPMAHSYRQIGLMIKAEKKYKVATQMGNQGHSEGNYFQFKAWVDAGIIKNVKKITTFMNSSRRWHGKSFNDFLSEQPIPDTIEWPTWNATARELKYNKGYTAGEWRSWFELGNGALGDWGAHIFDTCHEFLNLGIPEEVEAVKLEGPSKFIYPQASTLAFRFPARGDMPPCELTWYDGQTNMPPLPVDYGGNIVDPNIPPPTSGTIDAPRGLSPGKVIYGEGLTFKGGTHGSTLQIIPDAKAKEMASKLPQVPRSPSNHHKNFLLGVMGEEKCRSSFAVSGPLSQMMALGVIAQRIGGKFKFDREKELITDNKEANELLAGYPPRAEWEQYYKL